MNIARKGTVAAAAVAALLTFSAAALATPPGKQDSNFDQAAENAARYGSGEPGYGYSFGYANPYAAYGAYGTQFPPREPSSYGGRGYYYYGAGWGY